MSLVAAAVIPGAPLLVPDLAGGSADADADLRAAVRAAVAWLLDGGDEDVVVVAEAPGTGLTSGTWDWAGFGLARRGPSGPPLPTALGIGAWFLDDAAPARPRRYLGVSAREDPQVCVELGRWLAGGPVRLLVVADGTACRTERAPGFLREGAQAYDDALVAALAAGDVEALGALDPGAAARFWARGRGALQVLAGAAGADADGTGAGAAPGVRLDRAELPYGVQYVVARWTGPGQPPPPGLAEPPARTPPGRAPTVRPSPERGSSGAGPS